MKNLSSLRTLAEALGKAEITATELVEQALLRANTSNAVFITLNEGLASLTKAIDATAFRFRV
jgi:hypothetical protein